MNILYLYSEVMNYTISVFKEYGKEYNANVHVVHWDHKKNTPYQPTESENIFYYKRSGFTRQSLTDFASDLKPDIVYISGWMDKDYLSVVKVMRKNKIPVVVGIDNIWQNTFRQKIASFISPVLKDKYFSHAWVSGPYQYEYAKRLGFQNNQIIFDLYTAETSLFQKHVKSAEYPKSFLFVGRYHEVKGLNLLLDAFDKVSENNREWTLKLVGNGPLKEQLIERSQVNNNIIVKDFMQSDELISEIEASGIFVLPSLKEPWGVVVHEFCAAGMPVIISDSCGAAPEFVIAGYNGYLFKNNDIDSLISQMLKLMEMDSDKLHEMGNRSVELSRRISPQISAASFISVLEK